MTAMKSGAAADVPIGSVWERRWGDAYHVYKIIGHSFNGPVLIVQTERLDGGRPGHVAKLPAGWLATRATRIR